MTRMNPSPHAHLGPRVDSCCCPSVCVLGRTRVPDGEFEFGAPEGQHLHFEVDSNRVAHVVLEVARGEADED